MNISEATLKKRDKDAFDGGFEAGIQLAKAAPVMYEALGLARDLLEFHEGSAKPQYEGAFPSIRVNGKDWEDLLAAVRAALAKACPHTPSAI